MKCGRILVLRRLERKDLVERYMHVEFLFVGDASVATTPASKALGLCYALFKSWPAGLLSGGESVILALPLNILRGLKQVNTNKPLTGVPVSEYLGFLTNFMLRRC